MKNHENIVAQVLNFIENNLEKDIDLESISRHAGYSKFYLNRIFSESTGLTIHKYLQRRRLTLAAEKLANTDRPILQIAYEAGYDSQQSFSLAFKRTYLFSPGEYRRMGNYAPEQKRISMRLSLFDRGIRSYRKRMEEAAA